MKAQSSGEAGSPDGHVLKPELQVGRGGRLLRMKSKEQGRCKEKLLSDWATWSPPQEGAQRSIVLRVTGKILRFCLESGDVFPQHPTGSQVECRPGRGLGPAGWGCRPCGQVGDPTAGELPHLGCWPHREGGRNLYVVTSYTGERQVGQWAWD